MYTSCISKGIRTRNLVINESYISFCEGDVCAAALINIFENLHNVLQMDIQDKKRSTKDYVFIQTDLYQHYTLSMLKTLLLNIWEDDDIVESLGILDEKDAIGIEPQEDGSLFVYLLPDVIDNFIIKNFCK